MKITHSKKNGFTLIEIMIVLVTIGMLAGIAVPYFLKVRTFSRKNACITNLKQLDGAKVTWALDNKMTTGATPGDSDLFGLTAYIRAKPECPEGGDDYITTVGTVGTPPTCSLAITLGHSLP